MIHLSLNRLVCVGIMSVVTAGVYHTTRKSGDEILQMPGISLVSESSEECRAQQVREQKDILARFSAKEAIAKELVAGRINLHEAGERIDALNAGDSAVARRERRKTFSSGSAEAIGLVRTLLWNQPERHEVVSRLGKELNADSASSMEIPDTRTTDNSQAN
jgi:hypothetical protein